MGALTGDSWVCAECRSINLAHANQCYNCRAPHDLAAVDPETIDGSPDGTLPAVLPKIVPPTMVPREMVPPETAPPPFRPSRGVAALASILILGVAGMQLILTIFSSTLWVQALDGVEATEGQERYVTSLGILTIGIGALALIGWSLWLSRAVISMPALGLGYPATTGPTAFIENLIPGLNLYRVPVIVRDIVRRLDPGAARGGAIIFAAWIALLGGFSIPRIGGLFKGVGVEANEGYIRSQLAIQAIATGLVLVGAIFLVALIWWIEECIERRREAQLAGDATTQFSHLVTPAAPAGSLSVASPTQPLAPVRGAPDVVETRSALDAARSTWAPVAVEPEPAGSLATEPVEAAAAALPHVEEEPGPSRALPVAEPEPETAPVVTEPELEPAGSPEPPAAPAGSLGGEPHLTIRVTSRGMMTAEMDGETEPVILDDLTAYGDALVRVGGSAMIVAGENGMARLVARRAQRILEDAGVSVTTD
jgi:hypothetical protein